MLDRLLRPDNAQPTAAIVMAVSGAPGVGKTALTLHWAHRSREHFPDGQLYVNLRGFDSTDSPVEPADAIRAFLDALGVPPQRVPPTLLAQVNLYRTLMTGRRALVVLDNASDEDQVRPLLPGSSEARTVVTSRNSMLGLVAAEAAGPLRLSVLDTDEARDLLQQRWSAGRLDREPEAVERIINRCGHLPLALALVAARGAMQPALSLTDMAAHLESTPLLDSFYSPDHGTDLRTVVEWSYRSLSTRAARIFRLLGLHPGPIVSLGSVASLASESAAEVHLSLTDLTSASMLIERTPDRYEMHDLLRAYARELAQADQEDSRRLAAQRMFSFYLHSSFRADRALEPQRDPIEVDPIVPGVVPENIGEETAALTWFRREHAVLVNVFNQATQEEPRSAWQLAWALVTYFNVDAHWHDLAATQNAALRSMERFGDLQNMGRTLRLLSNARIQLGDLQQAREGLNRALRLFEQVGDPVGQANTHMNLSLLCEREEQLVEAIHHDCEALTLYRAADHRVGEGIALNGMGYGRARLGELDQALTLCQAALDVSRSIGHRKNEAHTADSLGYIYGLKGDHVRAAAWYRTALDCFQALGDRYNEAESLLNLGDAHASAGHTASAIDAWKRAAELLEALDDPRLEDARARLDSVG